MLEHDHSCLISSSIQITEIRRITLVHTHTRTVYLYILTFTFLNRSQYVSALYGDSLIYEITGEEPRVIISNEEEGPDVVVSKATVLTEYLVTFRVSH